MEDHVDTLRKAIAVEDEIERKRFLGPGHHREPHTPTECLHLTWPEAAQMVGGYDQLQGLERGRKIFVKRLSTRPSTWLVFVDRPSQSDTGTRGRMPRN